MCVVSDDITKSVEVRHRKACMLIGINSLSFDSLVDLHFRVQTVLIKFNSLKTPEDNVFLQSLFSCMILALKMKTEIFDSFLETRQPI